jgi:hypothetical protein
LLRYQAANAHRVTIDLKYSRAVLDPPGEVRQNNMDGGPQVIHFGSLHKLGKGHVRRRAES